MAGNRRGIQKICRGAAPVFAEGWRIGKPDAVITIPKFKLEAELDPTSAASMIVSDQLLRKTAELWIAELRPENWLIKNHAHLFVVGEDTQKGEPVWTPKLTPDEEYGKAVII